MAAPVRFDNPNQRLNATPSAFSDPFAEFMPARTGSLGIAVVTYNRAVHLRKVLEAVLAFTSVSYTLVVADDGSTDDTREVTRSLGITTIGLENRGIAWNKNRAIYLLRSRGVETTIILEDDTLPIQPAWERLWIKASRRYGYVTFVHPKVYDGIVAGMGTPEHPFACSKITSQCLAFSQTAFDTVGFLDTRFKGYGVEDGEWTIRFRRQGYGILHVRRDGAEVKANCMITGGVRTLDVRSYRDNDSVARNRKVLEMVRDDPVPRLPWRNEEEKEALLREISAAIADQPPGERAPAITLDERS
jgi:glycosyltransferase involved in cell wall biosynthesis